MSHNFGIEPNGNGNSPLGDDYVRISSLASHFGTDADALREAATAPATQIAIRKDSAGRWEMRVSEVLKLAGMLQKRHGLRLRPEMGIVLRYVDDLREEVYYRETLIAELKEKQLDLETENKHLRAQAIQFAKEGSANAHMIARSAIDVAEKAVDRSHSRAPMTSGLPLAASEGEADQTRKPLKVDLLGINWQVPSQLIPIVLFVAVFAGGIFAWQLLSKDQKSFIEFASKQVTDAETNLAAKEQQLEKKEQTLLDSEKKQKDISDELGKKNTELTNLGNEKKGLIEKVRKMEEQVTLLQGDRKSREMVEQERKATVTAQKSVIDGQSELIKAQQAELEALKKQAISQPAVTKQVASSNK